MSAANSGDVQRSAAHRSLAHMVGCAADFWQLDVCQWSRWNWVVLAALLAMCPAAADAQLPAKEAVQQAYERASFPWRNDATDTFQPAYIPVRESASSSPSRSSEGMFGLLTGARLLQLLMILVFTAFIVWLCSLLLGLRSPVRRPSSETDEVREMSVEQLEALPLATRDIKDFLAEIRSRLASGDYEQAMIYYHSWQLVTLNGKGVLDLQKGKTNRQYLLEIAERCPGLRKVFRHSNQLFEDVFFGHLPLSADSFQQVWNSRDLFDRAKVSSEVAL